MGIMEPDSRIATDLNWFREIGPLKINELRDAANDRQIAAKVKMRVILLRRDLTLSGL
jgi:hypothetical protein